MKNFTDNEIIEFALRPGLGVLGMLEQKGFDRLIALARKGASQPAIAVDRREVLELPVSQIEAFTPSGADCHPQSPHAVVWKLRALASPVMTDGLLCIKRKEVSPGNEAEVERLRAIIAAHDQYKADCPNDERDPIYEAIENARAALAAINSTGE